jgi:hypothetical protein
VRLKVFRAATVPLAMSRVRAERKRPVSGV